MPPKFRPRSNAPKTTTSWVLCLSCTASSNKEFAPTLPSPQQESPTRRHCQLPFTKLTKRQPLLEKQKKSKQIPAHLCRLCVLIFDTFSSYFNLILLSPSFIPLQNTVTPTTTTTKWSQRRCLLRCLQPQPRR